MRSPAGGYRIILPVYNYTTVAPMYPQPAMHNAAIMSDYDLAIVTGKAIAGTYGRSYLLDARLHHVLHAWTLRPDGIHESYAVYPHLHHGSGLGDTTAELVALGGTCEECQALLGSLPEPFDPRQGGWPDHAA